MDLRTQRRIYRSASRILAGAVVKPSEERKATALTVYELLRSASLIDETFSRESPAWVMVSIIDRLTIEANRKPAKRGKA